MFVVYIRVDLTGLVCFFFNDTATTEIYTLSLHDALPIDVRAGTSRRIEWRCRDRSTCIHADASNAYIGQRCNYRCTEHREPRYPALDDNPCIAPATFRVAVAFLESPRPISWIQRSACSGVVRRLLARVSLQRIERKE